MLDWYMQYKNCFWLCIYTKYVAQLDSTVTATVDMFEYKVSDVV